MSGNLGGYLPHHWEIRIR